MRLGPLTLFVRMHCNGKPSKSILIASLHWPWSLTWRFHCSWTPGLSGRIGPYFMRTYKYVPGLNFHAGLNLPVVGSFSVQTQPNMSNKAAPKPEDAATISSSVPDFADAYQGAREDLAIWRKRALEAEALNRKFMAEINGPTHMGEPVATPPSVPAIEPNNDEVICPQCCHQFRAIPVSVQRLMLDAGFEPPFTEQPPDQIAPVPTSVPSTEAARVMGAKGSPAQVLEAERLAFEAWIEGHCWTLSATWDGKSYRGTAEQGQYVCPHAMRTRQMWAAWRDRAALAAAQKPEDTP